MIHKRPLIYIYKNKLICYNEFHESVTFLMLFLKRNTFAQQEETKLIMKSSQMTWPFLVRFYVFNTFLLITDTYMSWDGFSTGHEIIYTRLSLSFCK